MNVYEVKNVVLPEKILKGTWPEGENMMFLTFETTRKGEPALLEDRLYFPGKGNMVLLFLKKSPGGELIVMNGPQGLWRVKDDGSTLVGILKQVEDEIKDPTSAKDYFNKALEAKDIAQQISFYTKAVQLDPNYALAYYNRGKLYYNLKNYKQALNDFNKTISLKPDYALAYYMRASLYNQTGNYEQARDDYNKAKTLNPKIPDLDIKSPN
jgi:tetratricopeptide (TPR) repeat protein